MKLSETVKPISHFKAHAAEVIRDIAENHRTYVITQYGEARAVVQDIVSYEHTQESLALLKMLAQSEKSVAAGRHKPVATSFRDLKARIATAQ